MATKNTQAPEATAPSTEFAVLTTVLPGPSGPAIYSRQYGRAGDSAPWKVEEESYAMLLDAVGIQDPAKGEEDKRFARSLELLKDYRTDLKAQFVLGNHIGWVEVGYRHEWTWERNKRSPAYVVHVAGPMHRSIEAPKAGKARLQSEGVLRLACPVGTSNWTPPDEAKFVGEEVRNRYPESTVQLGELSGAIYLTPPGTDIGNLPVMLYGTPTGAALYDLRSAFSDETLIPSDSEPNEVQVPFSKIEGMEDKIPDVLVRRGKSTPQMELEGNPKYYVEVVVSDKKLLYRFPSDKERKEKKVRRLLGRCFTAWSEDGIHWFETSVTQAPHASVGRRISVEDHVGFGSEEAQPEEGGGASEEQSEATA